MDAIYLAVNGQSTGPFTLAVVQEKLAQGEISLETSAWHQGAADWAPLGTVLHNAGVPTPAPAIPPPAPAPTAAGTGDFTKPQLRQIAKSQNLLMWAVATGLLSFFLAHIPVLGIPIVLAIVAFEIYALCMLCSSLRFGTVSIVLLCLTMFIPCVSLLVLVLISGRASRILKAHGVRVGLMGGNADDIKD